MDSQKVALVTGAARSIGRVIAIELHGSSPLSSRAGPNSRGKPSARLHQNLQ